MNSTQRLRVENAVRVLLVDHPDNDKIVEAVLLLYLMMKNADMLIGGEHVLGVVVEVDFRKLCRQENSCQPNNPHYQPRMPDAEIGQSQFHCALLHRLGSRSSSAADGQPRPSGQRRRW